MANHTVLLISSIFSLLLGYNNFVIDKDFSEWTIDCISDAQFSNSNQDLEISAAPENNFFGIDSLPFSGEFPSESFGDWVADAGDVNADGFDDILVTSRNFDSNRGRVKIYFGGVSMDTIAEIILTGMATQTRFGVSAECAGDFNGDSFDDVIVGTTAGKAYLYYGGVSMNNVPDLIFDGGGTVVSFGLKVAGADDLNSDGISDIIIGSRNQNRAYIYYGSLNPDNNSDLILEKSGLGLIQFGFSVSSAGDVNGDGFSDVLVGAINFNNPRGNVYLYYGGDPMNNSEDLDFATAVVNYGFGNVVSDAGDFNSDGFDDVLVGAHGGSKGYLFLGGPDIDIQPELIIPGHIVSGGGDFNGDGISDIMSSLPHNDFGKASVYFGGTVIDSIPDIIVNGNEQGEFFGSNCSIAGDVNNDSIDEFLVSAVLNGPDDKGRAYLYKGLRQEQINLFVIYQGLYDRSFDSLRLRDTAYIYLRSSVVPYTIIDSGKSIVERNDYSARLQIKNADSGNYFLVIKGRNILETWSREFEFPGNNNPFEFDFTSDSSNSYGNNMIRVNNTPLRYAIFSGDIDYNNSINLADVNLILNKAMNFHTGYDVSDISGDGYSDLSDLIPVFNNAQANVNLIRP